MIRQRESELLEALDNFVCKDPLSAGLIGEIMFIQGVPYQIRPRQLV